MSVINAAPINAGIPAIIKDVRYDAVSSYINPAIGGPAVIGIEHSPSKNPIPWAAPLAPHKSIHERKFDVNFHPINSFSSTNKLP